VAGEGGRGHIREGLVVRAAAFSVAQWGCSQILEAWWARSLSAASAAGGKQCAPFACSCCAYRAMAMQHVGEPRPQTAACSVTWELRLQAPPCTLSEWCQYFVVTPTWHALHAPIDTSMTGVHNLPRELLGTRSFQCV
jgi:hypothetical protein